MKKIILILLVGFLVGCSSNVPLKKMEMTHEKAQIIDQRENNSYMMNQRENNSHMSGAFKSTLSSFMPMSSEGSNVDMSWQQMLKDFYMNSNVMYYILFAISFITIGVLIIGSRRGQDSLKNNNKFNA